MNMQLIEEAKPLAQSKIWKIGQESYKQLGLRSWTEQGVPYYISSNPYIAKQYAKVMIGFIRDCAAAGFNSKNAPISILELGCGNGRFGYLFLKELKKQLQQLSFKPSVRYIMSDIAEKNIEALKIHPLLKPYIEEGLLDFSVYNPLEDEIPYLLQSQQPLLCSSPIAVIANYLLDLLPHELYRFENGELQEGRLSLHLPKEYKYDLDDSHLLKKLQMDISWQKSSAHPQAHFEPLFEEYLAKLSGAPFLIPSGAISCIEKLTNIAKNGLLFLVGDRGICNQEELLSHGEADFSIDGNFSLQVNFEALRKYFQTKEKTALSLPDHLSHRFVVALFSKGLPVSEATLAYEDTLNAFSPLKYWELTNQIEESESSLSFDSIFNLLRLGNWDPSLFFSFYEQIGKLLPLLSPLQRKELSQGLEKLITHYYHLCEGDAIHITRMSLLFLHLGEFEKALYYLHQALRINPKDPTTLLNLFISYNQLGRAEDAQKYWIELNSSHPDFLQRLQSQLKAAN